MSANLPTAVLLFCLTAWAAADLPRKAPLTKYRELWQNSPFTNKPVVDGGPPPPNLLENYALAGVSPIDGGYRVTVMEKKDPSKRTYVFSDEPNAKHGFRIISVERPDKNSSGTVVRMSINGQEGTVSYDQSLMTIATPAPQPQQPAQDRGNRVQRPGGAPANLPAAVNQPGAAPQQNQAQGAPRAPRPRVIGPPPTPQARPAESNQRPNRR